MATRRIWIMDGHNMIFAIRRLQGLQVNSHGDEARRELVERLRRFAQTRREDVLVVFDGNDLAWSPDVLQEPFLEVAYAAPGEGGADARIIQAARSRQKQGRRVTVVTNDVSTLASKLPERVDHLGVYAFRLKFLEDPAGRAGKRVEGDFSDVEKELEALAAAAEPEPRDHRPVGSPRTDATRSGEEAARERIRRKKEKGRLRQERLLKRRPKPGRRC
jgi:YacP-like NYN domain-containing protein